jgi:hypothetical protein
MFADWVCLLMALALQCVCVCKYVSDLREVHAAVSHFGCCGTVMYVTLCCTAVPLCCTGRVSLPNHYRINSISCCALCVL